MLTNHLFKAEESVSVKIKSNMIGGEIFEAVIATINYADGSVKIYDITDIIDYKSYTPGTHTVKWSDAWGDYEAELIVK